MRMIRTMRWALIVGSVGACGGQVCGEGTVEKDGTCLPEDAAMGASDLAEDTGDAGDTSDPGLVDGDGDGFAAAADCDDGNPAVHPAAREQCNDIDDDCDGLVDAEDPDIVLPQWFVDADGDGYGSDAEVFVGCDAPDGTVGVAGDCAESDPLTHPGAAELEANPDACRTDADEDGYGAITPAEGVEAGTDCDDTTREFSPGAADEPWDEIDQDCDGVDLETWAEVSAGSEHTCAIDTLERLVCWGGNSYGQSSPPAGSYTHVSVGAQHSCALATDQTVVCWGTPQSLREYGQVSDTPDMTATALAAGLYTNCAVSTDGDTVCWGAGSYGEASPPEGVAFVALAGASVNMCGLDVDGAAICWGMDGTRLPMDEPSGAYTSISAGDKNACVADSSGQVRCWGWDREYRPSGTFIDHSGGEYHSCAVSTANEVSCWGRPALATSVPPDLLLTKVSSGKTHNCGITPQGTLACWGENRAGQSTPP